MAVVQAFAAGSNNFVSADHVAGGIELNVPQELAIAVCIAVYGVGSDQALAATIGPLVEVPVLLSLTWVALYLKTRLRWTEVGGSAEGDGNEKKVASDEVKAPADADEKIPQTLERCGCN